MLGVTADCSLGLGGGVRLRATTGQRSRAEMVIAAFCLWCCDCSKGLVVAFCLTPLLGNDINMMSKVGGSTDDILPVGAVVDANKSFGGGVFSLGAAAGCVNHVMDEEGL